MILLRFLKLFYIIFNHLFILFRVPFTLAFLLLGTCMLCYHTVDAEKKLGRKCSHFVLSRHMAKTLYTWAELHTKL